MRKIAFIQHNISSIYRLRNRSPTFWGILLLLSIFLIGACAVWLASYDPEQPNVGPPRTLPNSQYLLGTDTLGRDILSRLLYSIMLAYFGAFFSVSISIFWGFLFGLIAGYYGYWFDRLIMRLIDIWLSLPNLLFILVIIALLRNTLGEIFDKFKYGDLLIVVLAIGLAGIPSLTRMVRNIAIYERSQPYIEAIIALGATPTRIIYRHILPQTFRSLLTVLATRFGGAILVAGSLNFVGVGVGPVTPELGNLLENGRQIMVTTSWVFIAGPVAILWLTMLGTNLISDGLSESSHS